MPGDESLERERPRVEDAFFDELLAESGKCDGDDEGCVRLGVLVVVTDDGYERLGDGSPSFAPRAAE